MIHLDPRLADSEDGAADSVQIVSQSPGVTSEDLAAVRADRGHLVPGFTGTDRPTGRPGARHRIHDGNHHLTRSTPTDSGERVVTVVRRPDAAGGDQAWSPASALFSARWSETAADADAQIPAWDELGPHPVRMRQPRLRKFLLAEPWAVEALPAVLTIFDQAVSGTQPVAIRYSDPDQALRALAAVSELLLPEEAWQLEFAFPVTDPARGRPSVMGVDSTLLPDWDIAHSVAAGVHLIDLDAKATSPIETSAAAARHAQWFIDADGDDNLRVALAGIAKSRRWSRVIDARAAAATVEAIDLVPRAHLDLLDARLIARAVGDLARARTDPSSLAVIARRLHGVEDWATQDVPLLADAVGELTRAEAKAPAQMLARTLLGVIRDHPDSIAGWDEAVRSSKVTELPPLSWPEVETEAVERLIREIVDQVNDRDLSLFLEHAAPLCPPDSAPFDVSRAERMAHQWADDPDAFAEGKWVGRERVIAAVALILVARFDAAEIEPLHQLRNGRWEWLRNELAESNLADPDDDTGQDDAGDELTGPTDAGQPEPGERRVTRLLNWLVLPEHLNAADDRRLEFIAQVADTLPEPAWRLFLGPAEDHIDEELVLWVERRRRLEHSLADEVMIQLTDTESPVHGEGRTLISALAGIEHVQVDHPELAAWIDNDHRVRKLWARARQDHQNVPNQALVSLADHHGEIIHLDHDEIVAALATLDDVNTATRMAEPVLDSVSDALAARLDEELRQARLPALAAALRLMEQPDDHWWGLAKDCLDELWDDRAQAPIQTELATKAMHLEPEQRRQLALYQQDQADGRLGRHLRRTGGALGSLARTVFGRD